MAACLRFTRRLQIHRAVPGEVEVSLKVEQYNLHGGLVLSLTDTLGSLAVASKGHYMTGVSTDIGTSFVRPAGRVGDVLHAKAVLTGIGKQLAYTRVDFTNPAGELVAYGYHTKYVGKSSSHEANVKFSEDGESVIEGVDKE
ncbi:Putative esterase C31F10.02 [Psilocybe cubensis]|uniref:Esterase C31F10.02 n=1 Tax=Psilocybe cubensis TaxID=181762 RepID=A0ACB8GXS9_PSICU|nr:Putative esterase C31F10.02 [Psilocybe cubensis]KAH9480443.1 Putative esterase C31F10.02 [Psilocybe cubensis]